MQGAGRFPDNLMCLLSDCLHLLIIHRLRGPSISGIGKLLLFFDGQIFQLPFFSVDHHYVAVCQIHHPRTGYVILVVPLDAFSLHRAIPLRERKFSFQKNSKTGPPGSPVCTAVFFLLFVHTVVV